MSDSLHSFLSDLRQQGIALSIENGELNAEATSGALTDSVRASLRDRRVEIIEVLSRRVSIDKRLDQARAAVLSDASIDWSAESDEISAAESALDDIHFRYIFEGVSVDLVSEAWKRVVRARRIKRA